MGIRLKKLNALEQLIFLNMESNVLAAHIAGMMKYSKDQFLGIYMNDEPAGIVILLARNCPLDGISLEYFGLFERFRGKGYAAECIESVKAYAAQAGYQFLYTRLAASNKRNAILTALFQQTGFSVYEQAEIRKCRNNAESRRLWEETCRNYCDKIVPWLERQGFETTSFAETDTVRIESLLHNEAHFDERYSISQIYHGAQGTFIPEGSFAVFRSGEPAAVTMLIEADASSVVFQLISAAGPYQNMGVVLLAIIKSMEWVLSSRFQQVSFCIFDYNEPMKRLSENIFNNMVFKKTKHECYRCSLER